MGMFLFLFLSMFFQHQFGEGVNVLPHGGGRNDLGIAALVHGQGDETVFRHFSTTFRFWPIFHTQKIKPWNIDKVHNVLHCHAFDDILDEYLAVKDKVIQ